MTPTPLPPQPPAVTVLVPARDEAPGIRRCIEQILAQDYPDFHVIAIDDRSGDGTPEILDKLAAEHPGRIEVIHVQPDSLPPGWLGKCNALQTGARQAAGDWVGTDSLCGIRGQTEGLCLRRSCRGCRRRRPL
jgi:chlorobactene glucosyltransferase